ncbi:RNA 2',3'-cyclic phosphodiesterase [Marinobacterium lutimaris]|uniref:RNA 2',3'-cyclic phosphodiesterase n=1 Tax=Marinobacterium lutimaris TaxID=568106 RepID=A0A1H5UTT0_9GAMM|nr:RNA 2',3'-cyclic phosphodiesterase [Marinobacterium lutimaris]SEF77617.1 2'-5' RNA ligase [Marinobacterium lutimaris]
MNRTNGTSANTQRLFIAIDLTETLQETLGRRETAIRGLSWSLPEQLHLTLAFIGKLPQEKMIALDDALRRIEFAPFELSMDRIGTFGKRTLWLGCDPSEALSHLHDQVAQSLNISGINTAVRDFRPHITLARSKELLSDASLRQLENQLLPEPLCMTVDRFALKNSVLTAAAPLHQTIRLYDGNGDRLANA